MELPELKKGDTLTLEVTKALVPHEVGTPKFALGLLALRQRIENQFADNDIDVTVVISGNKLHVCTDAEASTYNLKAVKSHASRVLYREKKLRNTEVANLTQAEKQAHARRCSYAAILSDGLRKSMRAALPVNRDAEASIEGVV